MSRQTDPRKNQPTARKHRLEAILYTTLFFACGVAMIIWPEAISLGTHRSNDIFGDLITLIWSIPGGIVLILVSLYIFWLAFFRSELKDRPPDD